MKNDPLAGQHYLLSFADFPELKTSVISNGYIISESFPDLNISHGF